MAGQWDVPQCCTKSFRSRADKDSGYWVVNQVPVQSREISMGRAGAAIDPSRRSVHAAAHLADFGLHALEAIHIRVDFAVPFPLLARLRRRFHAQTARNVGFQKQKMSSCHRSISRRGTGWYHVAQDCLGPSITCINVSHGQPQHPTDACSPEMARSSDHFVSVVRLGDIGGIE
jgi:hypothetical protein